MPRHPRFCPVGLPVHVVQRGNNRQACFACNADIACYGNCLFEASLKYQLDIHAWVFMTNHVHLLVTPRSQYAVSKVMQHIGSRYVRYFNKRYSRSGTLFEGRFKTSLVDTEGYLLQCQRYIEMNPVRAGMVSQPADYHWSSYQAHAFGREIKMWTPHHVFEDLDRNEIRRRHIYRDWVAEELDEDVLNEIRQSTHTGFVLGSSRFRAQVAVLTGRPQEYVKRGPKVG